MMVPFTSREVREIEIERGKRDFNHREKYVCDWCYLFILSLTI